MGRHGYYAPVRVPETNVASFLAHLLKASSGKDVKLNATVDDSLIGGLIVKLGSVMIDTSIKAKLQALQNAMKEGG